MASTAVNFKTHVAHLDWLNMSIIELSAAVVKKLGGVSKQRWVCTVNKTVSWQCGLVALGEGKAYINLNKKLLKEMKAKEGDEISVSLKKDESEYGMTMSVELKELLRQDKEGKKRYEALVPGKQRYLIYYVQQVKSKDLRLERAVRVIENLKKLPKGKESFKGLLAK
ncbi:MAG TPA: YdeI/OmpD-associated family protein [Cyclobacteriaceae bacterium]